MKRTSLHHTKTKKLARRLSIPHYAAVGILESLWHLTARETPAGNIGKLSNEDIALWIDWSEDPDRLIDVLVACEWLDRDTDARLVVHDWMEHCDDAVKKAEKRRLEELVEKCPDMSGQNASLSRNVQTCPDKSGACPDKNRLPLPLPLPEPVPSKEQNPSARSDERAAPTIDPRHAEFRDATEKYWEHANPGIPMPWDGSEAKVLWRLLKANPQLTTEQFKECLRHRRKSDVLQSERPRKWLENATDYASGPVDRFGKPREPTGMPQPGYSAEHANKQTTAEQIEYFRQKGKLNTVALPV